MKSFKKYAVFAVIMAAPFAVFADSAEEAEAAKPAPAVEEAATDKDWEASVGLDISTEYLFRGIRIPDNGPLWQPSVSAAYKGFSLWYWGGYGNSEGPDGTYEENDYGIDYTLSLFDDVLSVTGGGLMYNYPDNISGTDTYELYVTAAVDVLLSPNASLYWDIDEFHGGFLTLGIGHSFDLGKLVDLKEPMGWTFDPATSLGIDFGYNDRSTDSDVVLNDITMGWTTSFKINDMIEVHAGVSYVFALDALNHAGQSQTKMVGTGGVTLSF